MNSSELIPHLFRTEYSRITAVLCKLFGIENIQLAEDIASDTFLLAAETWGIKGLPPNPQAWLYSVAKNKARDVFKRKKIFTEKITAALQKDATSFVEDDIDLSEKNIEDSQLQMMFAICHPLLSSEAQVGLSLRILCGFGIEEIAAAFLSNKETINKRLSRAKEKLRAGKIVIAMPSASDIPERLQNVLTTIYLLFNEGYYSAGTDSVLRKELCLEAMRLAHLLTYHEATNQPEVNALLSLMCFHASRFDARTNDAGEMILYEEQDTMRWDKELIAKGEWYLNQASTGERLTKYHLEAAIAYWHTVKKDSPEKWENILQLYNRLLQIAYSPIAALNRTYALAKANGAIEAIVEAEKLGLKNNQLYHSLLGELYKNIDKEKAMHHLNTAFSLAVSTADKKMISDKMSLLRKS
ncbi:MAG: DUF6596 domain-containing protein [Ferruginibacter sp.]